MFRRSIPHAKQAVVSLWVPKNPRLSGFSCAPMRNRTSISSFGGIRPIHCAMGANNYLVIAQKPKVIQESLTSLFFRKIQNSKRKNQNFNSKLKN